MKINQIKLLMVYGLITSINSTMLFSQVTFSGKGNVIAIRFLELEPDIDTTEFEKFALEEFNPAFDRTIPGLKEYIAKSDRGIDIGSYSLLMVFDSQIVRNTIIPNKRTSDWFSKIMEEKNLWSVWNKLGTYVTDGSLSNYNDFVELR